MDLTELHCIRAEKRLAARVGDLEEVVTIREAGRALGRVRAGPAIEPHSLIPALLRIDVVVDTRPIFEGREDRAGNTGIRGARDAHDERTGDEPSTKSLTHLGLQGSSVGLGVGALCKLWSTHKRFTPKGFALR